MFKLVIEDDEGNKTIVPVIRDEISIGRQEGNTIRLTERNVSRKHAKLIRDNGAVYFEEVSARYGTEFNGEKVSERIEFGIGDVVLVGDYRLTLQPEVSQSVGAELKGPPKMPARSDQVTKPDHPAASDGTEIMPMQPARLVIVSSNFAGQEFPLDRKEMILGRGEECDIIIDHRSVSTTHAKIVREPKGVYKIVDLNSKNGVKVSGEEYKAIHLKRGDVIELGHVRFRFVEPGENYVFSPHMAFDDFEPAAKKTLPALVIGGVVLAFCFAAVVAAMMMPSTPDIETVDPKDDVIAAKQVEPSYNKKVDQIVADSRDHIKRGEIEKAIAKLDTARDLDPTADQAIEIDRLLSDAAAWAPLSRSFAMGRDYYDEEQFAVALSKFKEVSADKTTPIYALMMEQRYPQKTVTALLDVAREANVSGNKEKALDALEDVLLYDEENEEALVLKQQIAGPTVVAVNNVEKLPKKTKQIKKEKKKERDPEIDLAKGEELHAAAFDAFALGEYDTTIKICKQALRKHRYRRCHTLIGTAYYKLGNNAKACKHFLAIKDVPANITCE